MLNTRVTLLPAFRWVCPVCGGERFERAIVVALSEQESRELRESHSFEAHLTYQLVARGDEVRCPDCKLRFEVGNTVS